MTDPTHYPVYPYKTLGCALLIIGLGLVNCASMASYAEDYTKTTKDITLEARHIIVGMDVTVLQMTRIVRATRKQPERMRTLARRVSKLKRMPIVKDAQGRYRPKQPDDRLPIVMDEVKAIETELNLLQLEEQ